MKSGLEGRNNLIDATRALDGMQSVSMKSGLEGRNNWLGHSRGGAGLIVSMKSGLEGRNNAVFHRHRHRALEGLNEVRPRRPEQSIVGCWGARALMNVSMKSGLEGRNNGVLNGVQEWDL